MRQYVLPKYFNGESQLKLVGKDSQYFIKVLRLKIGDKIFSRDINGTPYQLTLISYNKSSCLISVDEIQKGDQVQSTDELPSYSGPYPKIHLFQCVCKGKKNESIIRMATELGVQSITLIQSKYCIAKKDSSNTKRFETIIKEAIQQSGSPIITKFNSIISFDQFISSLDMPLFFFHQVDLDNEKTLKEKLEKFNTNTPIGILVGPEGGLSDEECNILIEKGCKAIMLKTNILRAETAAVVAISSIHTLLMER